MSCRENASGGESCSKSQSRGSLVGTPAQEARRVAEAAALEVIEGHLAHQLGADRCPGGLRRASPSARSSRRPPVAEALVGDERLQLLEDGAPLGGVERRRVPDVVEHAIRGVQAEQQRTDARASGGRPIAANHAVDGAQVLHLDPAPLPRAIRPVRVLGDDAVEAGAFVSREPGGGLAGVGGLRRHPHRRAARHRTHQRRAPLLERPLAHVVVREREEVEEHD